MLMKAIGEVQPVGGAHFVERTSLLSFLDAILEAPSVEDGLRARLLEAEAPPRPRPIRVPLSADLRSIMLPDLPPNVTLEPGRLIIEAPSATVMVESLVALSMALQNDMERFQAIIEPPPAPPEVADDELRGLFDDLRTRERHFGNCP